MVTQFIQWNEITGMRGIKIDLPIPFSAIKRKKWNGGRNDLSYPNFIRVYQSGPGCISGSLQMRPTMLPP